MDLIHRRLHFRQPAQYRYWRILPTDVSWSTGFDGYSMWFYTVSFYASSEGSGTDICIGKTAIASSERASWAAKSYANDNSNSTLFQTALTGDTNKWWGIDLGSGNINTVSSIRILTGIEGVNSTMGKNFSLQYSSDASTWTTKKSNISTSNVSTMQLFTNL